MALRVLLEDLLQRSVSVGITDPMLAEDVHRCVVAPYVDSGGKIAAAVGLELSLAVHSAAALGLVPPKAAQEYVKEGELPPLLAENASEICNILGSLLNREGLPHIRLHGTYYPDGDAPPADALSCLLSVGQRLDLSIELMGYGGGRLALAIAL